MSARKVAFLAIGLSAAALTAGCEREATGQVAAVVDGEEITLQEINAEIGTAELPANADRKAIQQAALQRIVERRLLASAAREDGLDQDQEYLLRKRQLEDALLVQLLGKRAERSLRVPDEAALTRFMNERPAMFGARTTYTVDRIQFATPANTEQLRAFEADRTMDAVAARLQQLNIRFQRDNADLDSAQMPKPILDQILALPPGEPFVLPAPGVVTVGVITGSRPAPLAGDQARPLAVQAIRNEQLTQALQQRLKTERAEAKIEYQSGYAPPPAAKPKAGGAQPTPPAR